YFLYGRSHSRLGQAEKTPAPRGNWPPPPAPPGPPPAGAGLVLAVLAGAGWVVGMVYTLVVWPL
ncbi:morphogenic membrane protein MmpA, partial [Streptomyces sp. NPDC058417]|uniref:morphogenic membrane protein MmpA n=1 Tax=Streptomyces sp. NPDC058417 TaxID=3346487 RepID=UPI003659AEE0